MKNRGRIVAFFLIVLVFAGTIGTTVTGITKDINLGLDLQGGFEVLYEVEPVDEAQEVDRTTLESTVETLNDRVNRLGISEASIDIEGEDRIRVQLAGVENQSEARELLSTTAQLSFRDVNDNELLSGNDVKENSAKQDFDPNSNQPIVTLELKDAEKFGDVTSKIKDMNNPDTPYPDNLLVIWMDYKKGDSYAEEYQKDEPKFVSAPSVNQTLNTSQVMISGNFTVESAKQLANVINSGSLPVHMEEKYSTSVGAQFGEQALNKTVFAGFIGVGLIFLFMIAVYRFPGLIAAINLTIYIYLILFVFELMNGVLTLPGIAALILGVGMAVDANVITFERIKEELRSGKSIISSFKAGTKNSLSTILDANITTLIAASVLFIFGTSSVKGFATMLIVSILVSFITAVFGTRLLLSLWIKSPFLKRRPSWFAVKKADIKDIKDKQEDEPKLFNREINVVNHRKKFFWISTIMVVLGIVSLALFRLNPGIDFTSGSRIEILADTSVTTAEIENEFNDLGLEVKSIVSSGENGEMAIARFDKVLEKDTIAEVKAHFNDAYGHEPNVSVVSPIVGEELVKNAAYAVAIASVFMIIYVTIRFEFFFAITAIIALLHDAFFMIAIFSVTQIEFDITIIAAILTIVGYSINDTIVTFDRIRENLRKKKKVKSFKELAIIVNRSLVQTFIRSINTSITTLIAVLAFLFLGAESIGGFAIALTFGLVAGTYSSLFIASQLWLVWRGKMIKKKPVDFTKKKRVEGPQV
ncbi:protein translocase subunit SecDF [Virgibacillus pantothenticus]|uniref:protein translocase subunit SecDF n=1 Tax=Virgibacillus TaxID=84406 RepID=UPI00090C3F6C|nr:MULTISPECIES: protein translocase subunit SecDF [Virgibacillus]API90646.1 protein translocase subunit SecDF [Virgibacillus sp. 6R]MBS7429767.1 protein translocase subunit SecDF [Virgibacillus sp. 19R1-5]MBU8565642.1 protein translocase subunit SecDF [Virgibacillus pantothenticus]MBU8601276.1 protein translocase subunit SecDF [Virgibacillus pantothenticus]MBU8635626.1 protein translocase subunit SecDF [Virgibacillus pantothenticus]